MDLHAKPFYLDDKQIEWVENTLKGLSVEDKLGQLFLYMYMAPDAESDDFETEVNNCNEFLGKMDNLGIRPGGMLFRSAPAKLMRKRIATFQEHYDIPLLVASDLERGSGGVISEGTACGAQMEIAATGDKELAYKAGLQCARECAAVGCNWNFGPVSDIDLNPYSPITNVRTFGSDAGMVLEFASSIAKGMRDGGLIPCVKHWPGDGVDFRDQHFLATVNSLSMEEWDKTYGKVYKGMIDEGIETLMTAHIMMPAYSKFYNPDLKDEEILPASLEYNLHNKLLREKLGFNGLIITDASTMVGFTECMPRSKAVPTCIANGADMFLFTRDMEEDYDYMRKGYEDGIITPERLDEAVTRVLALKARIKLNEKKENGTLVPPAEALDIFKTDDGKKLAKEIADKGITLVKDTQNLLPFTPEQKKNIYVIALGDEGGYHNHKSGYCEVFAEAMRKKGFNVTVFDRNNMAEPIDYAKEKVEVLKEKIDVIIYFGNVQTSGSDSAARITWPGLRITIPSVHQEIPTMLISIDNPYLLIDAPRISTYINAYTSEELVVETIVEKIVGESEFKGVSPIDPFAGIFGAKL